MLKILAEKDQNKVKRKNSYKKTLGAGISCSLLTGAIMLSGCVGHRVYNLEKKSPNDGSFASFLASEYVAFARRKYYDFHDQYTATYFANKGIQLLSRGDIEPEPVERWKIPAIAKPELQGARERLLALIMNNGKTKAPRETAIAQSRYECWLDAQEENWHPQVIQSCRADFLNAVLAGEKKINPNLLPTSPYSLYYALGKTDVPPEAGPIIVQLISLIRQTSDYRVVVDGYADRTGNRLKNLSVSEKRAQNVKNALVAQGAEDQRIKTFGHGNVSAPGKAGEKNVKERRVDITLYAPEDFLTNMISSAPLEK